jgi:DNA-binding MarR family transcriptional regulator
VLDPLRRGGLVGDEPDEQGRRRLQLILTSNGRAKLDEAMLYWHAAQDEFERNFGYQQATCLRRELFRMTRDLAKAKRRTGRTE